MQKNTTPHFLKGSESYDNYFNMDSKKASDIKYDDIIRNALTSDFIGLPITDNEISSLLKSFSPSYSGVTQVQDSVEKQIAVPEVKPGINRLNVDQVRKDFPILSTSPGGNPLIWLDNAATTQKPQAMIDAISHFYSAENSNIHRGNHYLSNQATEKYDESRQEVANFINAKSKEEIIFVRGATEGINLVSNILAKMVSSGDEIFITHIEHHSNILPWKKLCDMTGAKLRVIPIDANGDIVLDRFNDMLSEKTKIVAMTHVSNALGTLVPVKEITKLAHNYGAYTVVDGAQSIPHLKIDVQSIDCDFFIFSGHKLFGPTGVGAVYGKEEILKKLSPWQVGGGMISSVTFDSATYMDSPYKFEAGTPHISGVIGLCASIRYLQTLDHSAVEDHERSLVDYTIASLSEIPRVKLVGNPKVRIGSIPFIVEGADTEEVGNYLSRYGIALRAGHHCAQPALRFFNLEKALRPSIALYNTHEEIDVLARALIDYQNHI